MPLSFESWRAAEDEVRAAWRSWLASTGTDRAIARLMFAAALDREQAAADELRAMEAAL